MTTALFYIALIVIAYVGFDLFIYVVSGRGPRPVLSAIDRAYRASDADAAKDITLAVLDKLDDWNEKERKMEYKSAWAASRYEKALARLKFRWSLEWPDELNDRIDALIGDMSRALPGYLESLGKAVVIAVVLALIIRAFVVQAFKIPSGSMIPTLYVGDQLLVSKFSYGLQIPFSGERVLEFHKPERGDIVVFKPPESVTGSWVEHEIRIPFSDKVIYEWESQVDFIKRIVGLPGDKVEVIDGVLHVNDKPMPLKSEGGYAYRRANSSYVRKVESWLYTETINGKKHKVLYDSKNLENEDWGPYNVGEGEFFAMGDNRDDSADSRTWTSDPARLDDIRGEALIIHFSWDPIENKPRIDRIGNLIH